ncbi:MAG: helix-hairpin-helix domain-containing protein [Tepidimonas sp.]|nr:helix-hairpin-helix domain-containing protein [Tepidimonas sp.]
MELNCAQLDELQRLRGVGPALAARIVQARTQRPFADWDDFERRVAGVGPRTAEALSLQGLRIGGRSYGMHRAAGGGSPASPEGPPSTCPRSPEPAAPARAVAPRPSRVPAPQDYPVLPGLSAPR